MRMLSLLKMLSFLYSSRMRWSLNWLRRRSCVVIRVRVRSCGVGLLRRRQTQRGVLAECGPLERRGLP